MKLNQLTGDIQGEGGDALVSGFAIDHRKVAPGTIFGAFQGARVNGEDFIADAVRSGAVAVVARPGVRVEGAVHIASDEPRAAFARLAAAFFAPFPATAVAVTGTNGKTSTVEMTRQLWRMAGHHAASIGTLGVTTADERTYTGLTTPDVVTFLSNVAGLAREGVTHLAFEASSHGLTQYRTEGLEVSAAAFTNLSRDHLDYHGDMGAYLAAKMRLFSEVLSPGGTAVVWADDVQSGRVIDLARARGNKLVTVGERGSTLKLVERHPTLLGQGLVIEDEHGQAHKVQLPLIGAYQAANALVAAGLVLATGGAMATTIANLARLQPVRGRLERAAIARSGAPIYVDYAHTPDAIEAAIAAVGLTGFESRSIGTLSGGQMQRALFARLLLQDADIILLDEPFTAIDARTSADLLALVQRWHGENRTVVAVLHDIETVKRAFPQTLLLAREAIAWGETGEVLTANNLLKARRMVEAFDSHAAPCAA